MKIRNKEITYEDLIRSVSHIVENDEIYKMGLSLVYELSEERHKKLNEHLFYKYNPLEAVFKPTETFEALIGGITVKFVKQSLNTSKEA